MHIRDVAKAFLFALENYDKMKGEIFNVGGDSLNFTKLEICNKIKECVPECQITASENGTDADKRDYQVKLSNSIYFSYEFLKTKFD